MARVEDIEREVRQLTPRELADFREWFMRYDADAWDRQIEQDAEQGRLDALADPAIREHENGESREL